MSWKTSLFPFQVTLACSKLVKERQTTTKSPTTRNYTELSSWSSQKTEIIISETQVSCTTLESRSEKKLRFNCNTIWFSILEKSCTIRWTKWRTNLSLSKTQQMTFTFFGPVIKTTPSWKIKKTIQFWKWDLYGSVVMRIKRKFRRS